MSRVTCLAPAFGSRQQAREARADEHERARLRNDRRSLTNREAEVVPPRLIDIGLIRNLVF